MAELFELVVVAGAPVDAVCGASEVREVVVDGLTHGAGGGRAGLILTAPQSAVIDGKTEPAKVSLTI